MGVCDSIKSLSDISSLHYNSGRMGLGLESFKSGYSVGIVTGPKIGEIQKLKRNGPH